MSEVILEFARHRCFRVPRRREPFRRVGHAKRKTETVPTPDTANFTAYLLPVNTVLCCIEELNRRLLLTGTAQRAYLLTGSKTPGRAGTNTGHTRAVRDLPEGDLGGIDVVEPQTAEEERLD